MSVWSAARLSPAAVVRFALVAIFVTASTSLSCFAQQEAELDSQQMALLQKYASIEWTDGPSTGQIGSMAEIKVPEGYQFTGASGAQTLLEVYGNPNDPNVLAAIVPSDPNADWTLFFEFDDIGYVDDSDRESIDAAELMSAFQSGIPHGNAQRRELGLEEMSALNWQEKPFYDDETNNLTWALKVDFPSGSSVNYEIRLLGRRGVMSATLVGDPATYSQQVPQVKNVLSNFAFTDGNKYSQWTQGDRVAAVGLGGLVAGGTMVAAAKTGLLGKIGLLFAKAGKAVVFGIIIVLGAAGSFVKRLFGAGGSATS